MKLTEAQREFLSWMDAHSGGSVIIRPDRRDVANSLIWAEPKLIEVYEWGYNSYIGKILPAGRAALEQEGK